MEKTWKNMEKLRSFLANESATRKCKKSAENANLPRIPIKTQGFLLKPEDSQDLC